MTLQAFVHRAVKTECRQIPKPRAALGRRCAAWRLVLATALTLAAA